MIRVKNGMGHVTHLPPLCHFLSPFFYLVIHHVISALVKKGTVYQKSIVKPLKSVLLKVVVRSFFRFLAVLLSILTL